ncbi:serine hydrolase domain-containing protein [Labilithrix luteola]|nr:serine hydrolase domain-containing protein [Labilithrix luteola]
MSNVFAANACTSDAAHDPVGEAGPSAPSPDASEGGGDASTCSAATVEPVLRSALESAQRDNRENPGWLFAVHAPTIGLDFRSAIGTDRATGRALSSDAPFRIASVTKTFVAAAVLRLVEDGRLGLDAPIGGLLPAPYPSILKDGGYDPDAITVHQLLAHTSGLYDYAQTDAYVEAVFSEPTHVWTREEQVRFAMTHGKPVGKPGEVFEYSDTGYVLLGAIIETITGKGLAAALRELDRFEALGLTHTWLETLEPAPADAQPRAPQTYGGVPLTTIDASSDLWGGGGLVSTVHDVEAFFRALFGGRVFSKPETLTTMLTRTAASEPGALGIFTKEIEGTTCFYHEGFWGILSLHCPALDLGIVTVGMEAQKLGDGAAELVRPALRAVRDCR